MTLFYNVTTNLFPPPPPEKVYVVFFGMEEFYSYKEKTLQKRQSS